MLRLDRMLVTLGKGSRSEMQKAIRGGRVRVNGDVQRVREIHLHRLHIGVGRIGKVDGDNVAHAGGHLIHQAAGLAKVDVLCPLADLRNGDGGDLFGHSSLQEQQR